MLLAFWPLTQERRAIIPLGPSPEVVGKALATERPWVLAKRLWGSALENTVRWKQMEFFNEHFENNKAGWPELGYRAHVLARGRWHLPGPPSDLDPPRGWPRRSALSELRFPGDLGPYAAQTCRMGDWTAACRPASLSGWRPKETGNLCLPPSPDHLD